MSFESFVNPKTLVNSLAGTSWETCFSLELRKATGLPAHLVHNPDLQRPKPAQLYPWQYIYSTRLVGIPSGTHCSKFQWL